MAFPRLFFLGGGLRCAECGLALKAVGSGARRRYKVDTEVWARKCKALRETQRPLTPFECPHLKGALHPGRRDDAFDGETS